MEGWTVWVRYPAGWREARTFPTLRQAENYAADVRAKHPPRRAVVLRESVLAEEVETDLSN